MSGFTRLLKHRHGSALLPALFVVTIITLLLTGILPLTVSSYGLARAERDRAAALAAAEAGLNWEIARINNRLWGKDDSGAAADVEIWPDPTSAPPTTTATRVLLTDSSG